MQKINRFHGKYSWLSNFTKCKIVLNDIEYPSIEHAYQSAKSNLKSWKLFCSTTESPSVVKKHSKTVKLIENWDNVKLVVMKECVKQKYNQCPFKELLINTGNTYIQEGNTWGDTFWGVDLANNYGTNYLGKLIMEVRTDLEIKEKQMPSDFLIYDFSTLDDCPSTAILNFSVVAGRFDTIENRNTYNTLDLYFNINKQINEYHRTKNPSTVSYWKNIHSDVINHISKQTKIDLNELPIQFNDFFTKHCNSRTKIFVRDKSFDPVILQDVYSYFGATLPYKYNYYVKDITTIIDVCLSENTLKPLADMLASKYNDIPHISLSNCYLDILKAYYALTKTEQEITDLFHNGVI